MRANRTASVASNFVRTALGRAHFKLSAKTVHCIGTFVLKSDNGFEILIKMVKNEFLLCLVHLYSTRYLITTRV